MTLLSDMNLMIEAYWRNGMKKLSLKKQYSCEGFSLFELLMVLLLMGILAGVAMPATGKFMANLEFRKKVAAITATFRYARLLSVTQGKEVLVAIDENNDHALRITGPVEKIKEFDFAEDDTLLLEPFMVAFLPEGYATPAVVTFTSGKRSQRITLDPLTGIPSSE